MLLDKEPDDPEYDRLINIQKLVENGSKLTYQLLGYAREGKYEVKPINLNRLVKETSNTFGLTRKEIVIHHDLAEDLQGIRVDQGQIEQTLLNFYVNALDAMPKGGELFLMTSNVTHMDMSGKSYKPKPGNYVLLSVKDTGIGMDEETSKRIFEPFFTTKGLANGTGLGLASAYGIIKGHGGYIDVFSELGHGATFNIYLPATGRIIKEEGKMNSEIIKGNETILFVDDEEQILEVGREMLKNIGYTVHPAKSGQEALDIYNSKQNSIDMVLLDMVMPNMNGGETYDKLKGINPEIKVLLSSGYSLDDQAVEILERGCKGFIQKPFTLNELSTKIREVLGNIPSSMIS
jgi:CheY-like chemotaxis protein